MTDIYLYIKRLFYFSVILCSIFAIIAFFNLILIKNSPFLIEDDIETIFIGDSRVWVGISDYVIPKSLNLGMGAEPILLSYLKTKHILENNDNIKNVIVGLSYENLSSQRDLFYYTPQRSYELIKRTYPLLTLDDFRKTKINLRNFFLVVGKYILNPNFEYLRNYFGNNTLKKYPYINPQNKNRGFRQYQNFKKNIKKSNFILPRFKASNNGLKTKCITHFGEKNSIESSTYAKEYIDRIATICKEFNVKLIFIGMPLHTKYRRSIPKQITKSYAQIKSAYKKRENIYFWDYTNSINNPGFFRDHDHLNEIGKHYFSEHFVTTFENQDYDNPPPIRLYE